MRNARLDEAQDGIKIAGRNTNNLRYADDTILMTETKELKSLFLKVKESEKADLKLNMQKTNIMASGPITSWQTDGEITERVRDFILGGSKITADGYCFQFPHLSVTVSTVSPSICHEVMGLDAMILVV